MILIKLALENFQDTVYFVIFCSVESLSIFAFLFEFEFRLSHLMQCTTQSVDLLLFFCCFLFSCAVALHLSFASTIFVVLISVGISCVFSHSLSVIGHSHDFQSSKSIVSRPFCYLFHQPQSIRKLAERLSA